MTDQTRDESFRERLIMVEQQQTHQKEVLVEINDALREVVKTQHILANQRKEIDKLNKDADEVMRRLHLSDIEDAKRRTKEDHQTKMFEDLRKKIINDIEPQQQKTKTYLKIAGGVMVAGWGLFLTFFKWWLERSG